jgi:amidase
MNAGYVAWWNVDSPGYKLAKEDAHVLQILWRAGAVFFARTTQPQSMMHLETDSNLYGVTVNPYNRNVSAGGSSGGEGALLAMRGSCLGLGTDVGGTSHCSLLGHLLTKIVRKRPESCRQQRPLWL